MRNATRLLDILDRAYNGPVCDEKEFDMKYVADGVAAVVDKYDLDFDEDKIIQTDDEMVDRVWQAGLEFFVNTGVYCTNTNRRITFTRDEVEENLRWAPTEVVIGEGRDACVERHRTVEDERNPVIIGGPIGTPLSEDMYVSIMQSYIQEPIVDTVTSGTLETTYGNAPRTRSPYEVLAAWEEVDLLFTAAKRAGRPGMAMGAVQMAISDIGFLSAISRNGYRPTDWYMIAMMSEMKTNVEVLNKVAHSVRQDGIIHGFYNPILGGLGGGEEGLAVLIVGGIIGLQMIYMATTHCTAPTTPSLPISSIPKVLRPISAGIAAISRNSNLMTDVMTQPIGGPGTEVLLYECISIATVATVSGVSRLMGPRSATGIYTNHCTGLESRFNGEVGHAATKLSREEADGIVKKAVEVYMPHIQSEPFGKRFEELYDPESVTPNDDWLSIYRQVKEKANEWGLPIP